MTARRPRVRLVAGAALAALLALLGLSEIVAARDRAAPGETEIDRDVAPARARLAATLAAMERGCADAAALALRTTAGVSDPNALFAALAAVRLPEGAGLFVEDARGRVVAWAGTTYDDTAFASMPRTADGSSLVETPASRRIAVRRTRGSGPVAESVPIRAVCHVPFAESFPLRNRVLTASSVEQEVAREFRVDEDVRVLPPGATSGEPMQSAFGGTLARLDVGPLSAQSWNQAVDAGADKRRAGILAALVLMTAATLWRQAARLRTPGLGHLARAALALAARAALGLLPLASAAGLGPLTDAGRYSHPLPIDVAGSPLSLLATCGTACLAAASIRRAARDGTARTGPAWRTLCVTVCVALACRYALAVLVGDVVVNSTVEFFCADAILPRTASAVLLAALLAAGVASLLLVEAAWAAAPPAERLSPARALGAGVLVAAALAPLGPETPHAVGLALVAITGLAAALFTELCGSAVAVRAAAIPLGAALAIFAPLEGELHKATRIAVAREAAERVSHTISAERLFVSDTLDSTAGDERLVAGLSSPPLPRDLALALWAKSPLARRAGGSSLEIEPLAGLGEAQRFSADLPPASWLPGLDAYPKPGEISDALLPGRDSGAEGRWIVGERKVTVGGRPAATLRVILEVRPPAPTLPELQVRGAARTPDTREAPPIAVTSYAPDGRLVETDDPYRPAGAPLDPDLRQQATDDPHDSWHAHGDLEFLVRPDAQDSAVTAIHAFSYDTGGTSAIVLRGTRAALCGALVSLAALLFTARSWAQRARLRLAQRLVVSYALVAALPLAVLGWANAEVASQRAEETTRRELTESVALLQSALREEPFRQNLGDLVRAGGSVRVADLRTVAYAIGHHANVFLGARLVAASDRGLFETELLPTRLPGPVYRNVILLEQPFDRSEAAVGGYRFDVGYAPLRLEPQGPVIGAVSVPLLHQRRLHDGELASALTAVLGLYLASLIAAVAVGTWLAGRLTRPLSDLTDAAKRVARGDLAHPVPGAGPDELGAVVSAFNQMQSDLGESREKLVRAEKEAAWRDMARQVAHEVKNPLTPMRLAAEHMRRAWRDKVPQFDEILERGVDLIVRQTEALQRIATAFGDFARFPNRRREPVELPALLDEVLDLYHGTPGVTIVRRIERPAPAISADPDELRRVIVNLAKNSVEALDGRKGTLTATLVRDGASLVVTLADDGPGIPEEILPRLFEPYLSTKTKGTGLGLAICKRAVDDLGGTIAIASRTGAGTTVTVKLPLPAGA